MDSSTSRGPDLAIAYLCTVLPMVLLTAFSDRRDARPEEAISVDSSVLDERGIWFQTLAADSPPLWIVLILPSRCPYSRLRIGFTRICVGMQIESESLGLVIATMSP